jgi:uncharacterized membrane protein YbaN (DUF454 family)
MSGAIPPLHQYVFIAWCLVKHRDNFTFYLLDGTYMDQFIAEYYSRRRMMNIIKFSM